MKASHLAFFIVVSMSGGFSAAAQEANMAPMDESMDHKPSMASMPMHQNMQKMHEQMQQMREANSDAEREVIMQEHMRSMRGMMNMLHGMMAGRSMKHEEKPKGMTDDSGCTELRPTMMGKHAMMQQRVDNLEERLNAMQLLLDQMLQSQAQGLQAH